MSGEYHDTAFRDAELAKLEAETREIELRSGKEAQEIEARKDPNFYTRHVEIFKLIPTYLSVFVTIGVFGIQFNSYLDQRETEQSFELDQKLITLSDTLVDDSSSQKQRVAAIQMAAFGLPAASILIENLDLGVSEELVGTTSRALFEIIERSQDANSVIDSLRISSLAVSDREVVEDNPNYFVIGHYASVLGSVSNRIIMNSSGLGYKSLCADVLTTLETMLGNVNSQSKERGDPIFRRQVLKGIEAQKIALTNNSRCQQ